MLYAFPLTLVPFLLFNIVGFWAGGYPWANEVLAIPMVAGLWTITSGDLMVIFGLLMLFFETLKAARPAQKAIANHLASTGVLILYLIEFILFGIAANSTFFILLLIALFDVAAGFTISIRTASRDISFGRPDGGLA
jgi:hypothetical protein